MPVSLARLLANLLLIASLAVPGATFGHPSQAQEAPPHAAEAPVDDGDMPCHDMADPEQAREPAPCEDPCCAQADCVMTSCVAAACLAPAAPLPLTPATPALAVSRDGPAPGASPPDDPLRPPIG